MTVKELMERTGMKQTGLVLAYTKDGLEEIEMQIGENIKTGSTSDARIAASTIAFVEGGGSADTPATPSGNSDGRLKGVGGYRSGGSLQRQDRPMKKAKPVSQPVRRNMANGGVAKAKPASRSGCCRGGGGRVTSRPAPKPAPLRGGGRSGGVR